MTDSLVEQEEKVDREVVNEEIAEDKELQNEVVDTSPKIIDSDAQEELSGDLTEVVLKDDLKDEISDSDDG